jgi:hypothetical protein
MAGDDCLRSVAHILAAEAKGLRSQSVDNGKNGGAEARGHVGGELKLAKIALFNLQ